LLLVLAAPVVAAPTEASAPTVKDDVAKARETFQMAERLYRQARYAEALKKFEEAYALKPHPSVVFNIARCYEKLNQPAKALRAYRDYQRMSPGTAAVGEAIANLERRLRETGVQQLMVFAEPPTAHIEVDGKDVGQSPASVELPAGNHRLVVRADGFEPVERFFEMTLSRGVEMTITLRPLSEKDEARPEPVAIQKEEPPPAPVQPPSPPPVEVTKREEAGEAPVFHRFFAAGRFNAAIPPAQAGATSVFASVLAGVNVLPTVTVAAGVLIASPLGFMVQAGWVPFNQRGRLKPVLSVEVPLVLTGPVSVGLGLAPGVRFDVTHFLSLGIDVPVTFFVSAPAGAPNFYVFATGMAAVRFF
jgi:hypothetical protein